MPPTCPTCDSTAIVAAMANNERLPDAFKVSAADLISTANGLSELLESNSPIARPGSRAADDLKVTTWNDDRWGAATFELVHDVGPRFAYLVDLLRAQAAVLRAPGTVLATGPLLRTLLEVSGTLCWIYDAEADTREKVRRRYNLALSSITERINLARDFNPGEAEPSGKQASYVFAAKRAGFTVESRKHRDRASEYWLEDKPPSQQALISLAVNASARDPASGSGPTVQRLTSALAHGQFHGLDLFLQPAGPSAGDQLHTVELALSPRWMATFSSLAIMGTNAAVTRVADYCGWDLGRWDAHLLRALDHHREWLAEPA